MGFLNKVNRIWSGLDFWDKKENKQQRDNFAQKDEEERRRKAAEAQARAAQAQARVAQAQANRPSPQQSNIASDNLPRKPNSVATDPQSNLASFISQVHKPIDSGNKYKATPEQIARKKRKEELEAFKTARMARALEQEKKNTSWFDRQFTDRGWDKRAEARAISGAAQDYQEKHGWNKDQQVLDYGRSAKGKLSQAENTNASKWIAPALSAGRVGTGIVQGAAGLYDILTPGEGTNRLSDAATRKAEEQDQLAKDFGINGVYKAGNVAGELASFYIPGVASLKIANAIGRTVKGGNILSKAATKVDDLARLVDKGGGDTGKFKQFMATRMRQNFTLEEALQELMITGRYVGQNAGRGDETTWQSLAIDAIMAGAGALTIPTRGLKRLIDGPADPGTGGNVPRVPDGPPMTEVAQGVFTPNTAKPDVPPPAAATPPTQAPNTAPPAQQPSNVPAQPPTQQPIPVETPPPAYTQVEAPAKPVPMDQPPAVQQVIPEVAPASNPIETPIVSKSKAVAEQTIPVAPAKTPPPAPVNTSDGALSGLRGQREDLITYRDSLAAEGVDTLDLDRRIARLDKAIADKVAKPTKEAKVLEEGDKQLAEAKAKTTYDKKPEIKQEETPSKPKKVKKEDNVNTKVLTPEEMKASGNFTDEQIEAVMAYRASKAAETEAPKTKKSKKADVAQSKTTPVKEQRLKTQAQKDAHEKARVDAVKKAETEALNASRAKTRAKTIAEESKTTTAKSDLPSKPKKPTQAQLNKGAVDNTNKGNGKVSEAWKTKQRKAGATEKQLEKAVEKVEGKKAELTVSEKELAARRAENNRVAKENKAKAQAEGKDKQAAPGVTSALAEQTAKATSTPKERASIARRYAAETKGVNIEEGMTKAQKSLDEVSDDGILEHVRKLLDDTGDLAESDRVFNSIAISKRLDAMREAAGEAGLKLDDDLIKLADEVAQTQALTASTGGLLNRLTQEIYKNIPAPVRVQKRLDELSKRFEDMKVDFKPSEADKNELIRLTYSFDKSSTSMVGLKSELDVTRLDYDGKTTRKQGRELFKKHKQLDADHIKAQEEAVASSLAFNDKLESILPELPKKEKMDKALINAPDHVGNYLRLSMLSGLSGRTRDAGATAINVADQSVANLISSTIGKGSNKFLGTNVIDGYGSKVAIKKGVSGAWDKIKASWAGMPTLDEATGRINTNSRAELARKDSISSFGVKHGKKGSKWNIPKKAVTTGVQLPTDASYPQFTQRTYKLGEVDARAKGITDKKQIAEYAEMFMDNPPKEAAIDAGKYWLESSGMQKNKLSKKLMKTATKLEEWGKKTVDSDGNKLSAKAQFARKSLAMTVRTTTIPFVQYTGGSTHSMLTRQNPISNVRQLIKAHKAKDNQAFVDELSSGIWNTAKIGGLIAAMESNIIETSETGADGVTKYNGPYVVRNGRYIPMGSYGIAAGAALISAHYLKTGYAKIKSGDVVGGLSDVVSGPPLAIVKASGLDNMLSGSNVLGGATENFQQSNRNPDMTPGDVAATVAGGLVGDLGSQSVPAAARDLNVIADKNENLNPTGEKPDTSGKTERVGTASAWEKAWRKAYGQVAGGVPVVSQTQFPRKSGEQARDFWGRTLNADTQSEQQKAAISAKEIEQTTTTNRTADIVKDDKVAGLLGEEARAIYDKYKGDMSKASQQDSKTIWREVTAAKDRLLDDGSYESYSKILTHERDEAKARGSSTVTEIAEMDRKISRSNVAKERNTDPQIFRLYANVDTPEGGGISQGEFKKMLQLDSDGNPKYPDLYDPDTATLLWELDEAMTKAGASANTNGIDPWTRNKYNLDAALGRGEYGKTGSGGSKDKGVGTNFGTIGAFAKAPGAQSQKYQKLTNTGSPLANLTASSSKTKLRKNISVVKGVRL